MAAFPKITIFLPAKSRYFCYYYLMLCIFVSIAVIPGKKLQSFSFFLSLAYIKGNVDLCCFWSISFDPWPPQKATLFLSLKYSCVLEYNLVYFNSIWYQLNTLYSKQYHIITKVVVTQTEFVDT